VDPYQNQYDVVASSCDDGMVVGGVSFHFWLSAKVEAGISQLDGFHVEPKIDD